MLFRSGVLAASLPRLRQVVLGLTGVLQTVPSLALLALLIPLLGMIGTVPALVALVVYALLPIVRNTCTGLLQVPAGLKLAALALGLRPDTPSVSGTVSRVVRGVTIHPFLAEK